MVIIGAKGFAKEILHVLYKNGEGEILFYDDVSSGLPDMLYERFRVIRSLTELCEHFKVNQKFIMGVGGTLKRKVFQDKITEAGGVVERLIAQSASIGQFGTVIGKGCIVLDGAIITNDVTIGESCIINKSVIISHDVRVGNNCEISPGARLLGRVHVGNNCSIGTNAVILPDVVIGDNCVVGAGSIVTKNVIDGQIVIGMPAKAKL